MSIYIKAVCMFRFLFACAFVHLNLCVCLCVCADYELVAARASWVTVLNFMALADKDIPLLSFSIFGKAGWQHQAATACFIHENNKL